MTLLKARSYRSVLKTGFRLYMEQFRSFFKKSWLTALVLAILYGTFGALMLLMKPNSMAAAIVLFCMPFALPVIYALVRRVLKLHRDYWLACTRRLEDATEEYRTDAHRTVHQCPAGDAGQLHRADSCRHTLPGQPESAARNAHRRPLRDALLHDGADLLHLRHDGFRAVLCQPAAVGPLLLCVWLHTGTRGKAEEPAEPDSVKTYNDRLNSADHEENLIHRPRRNDYP